MSMFRSKPHTDTECTIAGLYDLSQTIGRGHFAVVKIAKHVFTGEKVAVKVIDKTRLDPISREHLFQEVRCMKLVQHPHIVRLYEVIDTHTKLYLILELGDGDLYDYIMKNNGRGLAIDTARMYFTQILEAISYCHDLHVVHRDLKPENVIFFEKFGIVKLTDFGFSNRFEPDTKLDTSCGSLAYSAPEILLGDSYDAPAVDVWSLGVLLYMLVCGDPPFQEANDSETLTMIMDCKYKIPPHLPSDCANLISSMLRREPKERISLKNIVSHPWMQGGGKCCENLACVSLVGKEHLSPQDQESIIQTMVDGNIASRSEILRALDSDAYTNVTATFYLLAERKLKKNHAEQNRGVTAIRGRPSTAPRPRLEHSLSSPDGTCLPASERMSIEPSSPKSAPYDSPDSVFSSDNTFPAPIRQDALTILETQQRKFSLINEEDEEDEEEEVDINLNNSGLKETKSATWSFKSPMPSMHEGISANAANAGTALANDFEQSLSNMSIENQRNKPSNQPLPRPLRTVTSSPQLLPLKQIYEETEMTSDEDALSTHSQTSMVRHRHSSVSMASPEVARRILSKKMQQQSRPHSGSDTSDNDEERLGRDPSIVAKCSSLSLPHKRKDSSGNSSDNDGPSASGSCGNAGSGAATSTNTSSSGANNNGGNQSKSSPCAKKKYDGTKHQDGTTPTSKSSSTCVTAVSTISSDNSRHRGSIDSFKTAAPCGERRSGSTNGNNNNKDDNSLRLIATKFVDSSLARLSNFSLASQTSSLSSKSSAKHGDWNNSTPRSSQRARGSKDSAKFSKSRLMAQGLKMDFNELSDRELTDSDCGSLHSSIRIKYAVTPISAKECSVITEEQSSLHTGGHQPSMSKKSSTACCSVM